MTENVFELSKVQKAGALFNPEKLEWMNREYIKKLSRDEQLMRITQFMPSEIRQQVNYQERIVRLTPVLVDRLGHFGELTEMWKNGELTYFFVVPEYQKEKLYWKNEHDATTLAQNLNEVLRLLDKIADLEFTEEAVKEAIFPFADAKGRGVVLWGVRYALSGRDKSPDPFQLAGIIGKTETMLRIRHAIALLSTNE